MMEFLVKIMKKQFWFEIKMVKCVHLILISDLLASSRALFSALSFAWSVSISCCLVRISVSSSNSDLAEANSVNSSSNFLRSRSWTTNWEKIAKYLNEKPPKKLMEKRSFLKFRSFNQLSMNLSIDNIGPTNKTWKKIKDLTRFA